MIVIVLFPYEGLAKPAVCASEGFRVQEILNFGASFVGNFVESKGLSGWSKRAD